MVHFEIVTRHKPRRAGPKREPATVRLERQGLCYNQPVEQKKDPPKGFPRRTGIVVGIDGLDRPKVFWDDRRSEGKRSAKSVPQGSIRPRSPTSSVKVNPFA